MTALMVAFGSAAKRTGVEQERALLRRQTAALTRANKDLMEKLRWTEGRCARAMMLGKELNTALLEEQTKNRTLTERLKGLPPSGVDSSG